MKLQNLIHKVTLSENYEIYCNKANYVVLLQYKVKYGFAKDSDFAIIEFKADILSIGAVNFIVLIMFM